MAAAHQVYLEVGSKRVFACSLAWPGWARAGKTEDEALERLVEFAPRYRAALSRRVPGFTAPTTSSQLKVVERVKGNATTDFGAPGVPRPKDGTAMRAPELERAEGILKACWAALDRAADKARGVKLSVGPRGGGRNLDAIIRHVAEAEDAYLHGIGGRYRAPAGADEAARIAGGRKEVLITFLARARGEPAPENPRRRVPFWPPRYFARRVAWHALDHTWEIRDRSA
jgi:hypothetical protein